jgi:adenylate cyclase
VNLEPDKDGVYRRLKLFGVFDGKFFPSLGLGIYLASNPQEKITIKTDMISVGEKIIPIDKAGNTILCYRGPTGTHKNYSAASVLKSEIQILHGKEPTIKDKNVFRDKYVLFGFSAPGLYDLRPVPVGGIYPGVEIHATMLDNFLSGDFIRESSGWKITTLVFILSLTSALFISRFKSIVGIVVVSALLLSVPVAFSLVSYIRGFWFSFAFPETSLVAIIALSLVFNYVIEGRQKRFIKSAFKQYLSPAVIEELIQYPERLKLGGERRILSIFFSDLQGFTSISEGLQPEKLTAFLNDYLSAMTDIIHYEGGTIDKYEGDAIIAFWNAPLEVPDHAERLVRASLNCQKKLEEMQAVYREQIGEELFMRIGANTGPAVVGNMGSHTRFNYTILGDAVNLAARLEGVNKEFGTYILISKSTRDMIGDKFAIRELGKVTVVGRRQPVNIYEPMLWEKFESHKEVFESFIEGLDLFYQGKFSQAVQIFSDIRNLDKAAAAYEKKCRELMDSSLEYWDGVWNLTTK